MITARVAKDISDSMTTLIFDTSELTVVLRCILQAATKGQSSITLDIRDSETFEALLFLNFITAREQDGMTKISWTAGHKKRDNARAELSAIFDEVVDNILVSGAEDVTVEDKEYFVEAIMEIGK